MTPRAHATHISLADEITLPIDVVTQSIAILAKRRAGKSYIFATDDGRQALGSGFEPLPKGAALAEWWLRRLPEGERQILQFLIESAGVNITREAISERTGYARSTRDKYIQYLIARKLIEAPSRALVRATPGLLEA